MAMYGEWKVELDGDDGAEATTAWPLRRPGDDMRMKRKAKESRRRRINDGYRAERVEGM